MISAAAAYFWLLATLVFLAWVGLRVRGVRESVDDYITARGTQTGLALGLSFFASGMGAWILFAPPEVGAFIGITGVVGYALAAGAPLVVFAVIGPRLRRVLPKGHGLTEFVRVRYGRAVHAYVVGLSILYMLVFVAAELTAIGGVAAIISGIDARAAIAGVLVTTLAYTAYGGLRASLRTDSWQAWMVFALLGLAAVAIFGDAAAGTEAIGDAGLLSVTRPGVEAAITLIVAVIAANLFHQGYWQRIWSASDERSLVRGAGFGVATVIPVVLVCGVFGMLAAGAGTLGEPPVPFFALLGALPSWMGVIVLVLGIALVASSVDTLESGLASLVVVERSSLSLGAARVATVVMVVPAAAVAFQGYSVLRIFLIADLLCATALVPVLLGLWRRATAPAALAGSVAGLIGAVVPAGISAATFPGAVPTLGPFLGALIASGAVTAAVSLAARRETRLEDLAERVPATERA